MSKTSQAMSTTTALTGLHISGRRWFDRRAGNTYHSVRIYANGELLKYLPFSYGYGDQFLQNALDYLKTWGHVPEDAGYGARYLREELGGTYDVADVARKKDL
jgi:hypothetical protein